MEINKIYNQDCLLGMKNIASESVDVILTDPPYKYLKNQKLEVDFDETIFFNEAKRILKKDGLIVLFGRGTSFYRWNTMLADMGFNFKEEIIWDKNYCTSPLMAISRVHETISIHSKGKGSINKVKVPYLEMKSDDLSGIITDIKRLKTTFKNTTSLDAVIAFLEHNKQDQSSIRKGRNTTVRSDIFNENRSAAVMRSVKNGMNEKSIIRYRDISDRWKANNLSISSDITKENRCVSVMRSMQLGMNEKTIIKESREHYSGIHPTQKPVRLLERLLALVSKEGDLILDPFSGSGSTACACINANRNFIGFEIDEEYYLASKERIDNLLKTNSQSLFNAYN